ncbi:hypothetical protein HOB10_05305 [Candidatus Parcubacteria bacterium]|jgi:hypothetical protein|nr:hypothetical protein [Candidatus Parcubacteria bacterium]
MNKILFFSILLIVILAPNVGFAQGFLDKLPETCIKDGNCSLEDITLGFTYLIQMLLGGMGAIALLYFIWGGIQWLVSGGNADRVKRGQQIMINTLIALFIAFSSYLLTSFFVNDILGVTNSRYKIAASCTEKAKDSRCNETETNYVCTGTDTFSGDKSSHNETCVTKCQLKNLLDDSGNWSCFDFSEMGAIPVGPVTEAGLCPGSNTNLCTLNAASL